jgi:RNA-binding protein NOB1
MKHFHVIDTNALLEETHFLHGHIFGQALNSETNNVIWTVPEVFNVELRTGRERMTMFKDLIKVVVPDKVHIDRVVQFAKLTGDYVSLSAVDIQLVALTLQLEYEARNGDLSHIRTRPLPPIIYKPKSPVTEDSSTGTQKKLDTTEQDKDFYSSMADEDGWITEESLNSRRNPHNQPKRIHQQDLDETVSDDTVKVSCITADFAMQNVLVQMGLQVLAPNGRMITNIKSFVMRCHACYYIIENSANTRSTITQFCPSCGNPSLIKTTIGIDAKTGERVLYLKSNFQYRVRGTVYSIPKPKGGRPNIQHGKSHHQINSPSSGGELLLRPDQKEYIRALKGYERSLKKDLQDQLSDLHLAPLGDDGVSSSTPTLGSKSVSQSSSSRKPPIIGYGRKNPNQSKRG